MRCEPILAGLGGRRAVVRVLDFGADKSPPFLADVRERGLELLLAHPDAFMQPAAGDPPVRPRSRAVGAAADGRQPLSRSPSHAALLEHAAAELGIARLPRRRLDDRDARGGASMPRRSPRSRDLLSIGTNDLTASTLGVDRFTAGTRPRTTRACCG